MLRHDLNSFFDVNKMKIELIIFVKGVCTHLVLSHMNCNNNKAFEELLEETDDPDKHWVYIKKIN